MLGLDAVSSAREYSQELVNRVRVLADLIGTTITRVTAERRAREHAAFEVLVADVSRRYVNLESGDFEAELERSLQAIGSFMGADRCFIFLPDEDSSRLAALVVAPDLEPSEILAQLRPCIEPAFLPRPLYRVPALPRQETGKLARNKLVELYTKIKMGRLSHDDHAADNSA